MVKNNLFLPERESLKKDHILSQKSSEFDWSIPLSEFGTPADNGENPEKWFKNSSKTNFTIWIRMPNPKLTGQTYRDICFSWDFSQSPHFFSWRDSCRNSWRFRWKSAFSPRSPNFHDAKHLLGENRWKWKRSEKLHKIKEFRPKNPGKPIWSEWFREQREITTVSNPDKRRFAVRSIVSGGRIVSNGSSPDCSKPPKSILISTIVQPGVPSLRTGPSWESSCQKTHVQGLETKRRLNNRANQADLCEFQKGMNEEAQEFFKEQTHNVEEHIINRISCG